MKRFLVLAAAAAMLSVAAPAMAGEAPAPAAAAQDAEREAREALVRRYFAAAQFDKMTNVMMEQMMVAMLENSAIPDDKRDLFREAMLEGFSNVLPQMNEGFVDLYADIFTREELEQLVAFYESPIGRSVTAKTVVASVRTGEMMQRFQPIMEEQMMSQLCARMDCSVFDEEVGGPTKGR